MLIGPVKSTGGEVSWVVQREEENFKAFVLLPCSTHSKTHTEDILKPFSDKYFYGIQFIREKLLCEGLLRGRWGVY